MHIEQTRLTEDDGRMLVGDCFRLSCHRDLNSEYFGWYSKVPISILMEKIKRIKGLLIYNEDKFTSVKINYKLSQTTLEYILKKYSHTNLQNLLNKWHYFKRIIFDVAQTVQYQKCDEFANCMSRPYYMCDNKRGWAQYAIFLRKDEIDNLLVMSHYDKGHVCK